MLTWDSIERELGRFLDFVRADRRVNAEFELSRGEFFTAPEVPRSTLAELRHLEWFLLERPSTELGSTPIQAWQERWRESLPAGESELAASFLQSIPGAFEVTSLVPGQVWVRDLFTIGEHPVVDARAMTSLTVGDLLVGRLFPNGTGGFLSSPSVSVFRNPGLVAAVRADLESMRAARRGVLRVQQLELERIFHGTGAEPLATQEVAEVRERVRTDLLKQGVPPKVVAGLLKRVQTAARASKGQVITEILNGLAFETGVDLAQTRLVLVQLWDSERRVHSGAADIVTETPPASQPDARAALAAFDRGRAAGKDLEQLFRDLERDLGLDDEDGEEESEEENGAPDFPGVIGGVVEEFLWEVEREQGPERAQRWGVLRTLGRYGRDIGVFEDLGYAQLLDFSARWLLDESGLSSPEAETLLEALTSFCQWSEERHVHPLWRQFGATLDSLRASLPRHMALRRSGLTGSGAGPYCVIRVGEHEALVSDGKDQKAVVLSAHQAAHLRSGDLVRLSIERGRPLLGATYPGELRNASPRG